MKNLLKFELRKLVKNPLFYILMGVIVALIAISAVSFKVVSTMLPKNTEEAPNELILALSVSSSDFFMQTLSQSNFTLIIAIFATILAISDDKGFAKNVISRGYSREKVFLSRYLVSLLSTAILLLVAFGSSYPVANLILGATDALPEHAFLLVLGQCLSAFAIGTVYFLIATLVNNIALGIIISVIAPSIVTLILGIIDAIAKLQTVKVTTFWVDSFIGTFSSVPTTAQTIITIVMAAVYIALGIVLGLIVSKKKQY